MLVGLELGGTITGEHGVGMLKMELLERELGAAVLEVHRAIKKALDPQGILNPGKVFDSWSRASRPARHRAGGWPLVGLIEITVSTGSPGGLLMATFIAFLRAVQRRQTAGQDGRSAQRS